jgi:hypothetical protein
MTDRPEQSYDAVVPVTDNVFQLTDDDVLPEALTEDGDLVNPVLGGLTVLCGISDGPVRLRAERWAAAPPPETAVWDESAEVAFPALVGRVRVTPLFEDPLPGLPVLTAGPGNYRARVYARGRDIARNRFVDTPTEHYLIQIWPDS